jgi:ABC-type molybdate transport system substrate-binding protein
MAMNKNDPEKGFPARLSPVTGQKTSVETQAFIRFINSPEGRSVLAKTGNLPVRGKE